MGILTRVHEPRSYTIGNPLKDKELTKFYSGGRQSTAGTLVNEHTMFTCAAVFNAVDQISSDTAKLPLDLKKRRQDGGADDYVDSKVYRLMKFAPNPECTPMVFRRTVTMHALISKGGYAEIERDGSDKPVAFWFLDSSRVKPFYDMGAVASDGRRNPLRYRIDGKDVFEARDILHIQGLGSDVSGAFEMVEIAREAIGLALASQQFASAFFGNGTRFGGILMAKDRDLDPGDEDTEAIMKAIASLHERADKAFRTLVLGAGFEYKETGVNPSESQMKEVRDQQVMEVARFFNMPLHKLKLAMPGAVSYSSVEMFDLDYYKGPIQTWATLWEQELNAKAISSLEWGRQFFKHNIRAFLRSDFKTQNEGLALARTHGVINADDWREYLDMNPQPDGQGKLYLVQGAQVPLNKLSELADAQIAKAKAKGAASGEPAPVRVTLDSRWTELLRGLPESGMGFQRVDVVFADGRSVAGALVFNAVELELPASFSGAEIIDIQLSDDARMLQERVRRADELAETALAEARRERDARIALEASGAATAQQLTDATVREQDANARAAQAGILAESLRADHASMLAARDALAQQLAEQAEAITAAEAAVQVANSLAEAAEAARQSAEAVALEAIAAADQARTTAEEASRQALERESEARVLAESATADRIVAEQLATEAAQRAQATEAARLAADTEAVAALERAEAARVESDRLRSEADAARLVAEQDANAARDAAADAVALTQATEAARGAADIEAAAALERAEVVRVEADRLRAESDAARLVAEQEAATAREALSVAETTHAALAERVRDAELRDAEARAEAEQAAARTQEAHESAARLESDLAELRAQLERRQVEWDGVSTQQAAELDTLRSAHATLEREGQALATRAQELEAESAEAAAERTRLASDLRAARESELARLTAVLTAHRGLIVEAMGRMIRWETSKARRNQATPAKLSRWLESFYVTHEDTCCDALLPAVRVHLAWQQSAEDPTSITRMLVREHVAESVRELRAVTNGDPDDLHVTLERMLQRWEEERPAALADRILREEINYVRAYQV